MLIHILLHINTVIVVNSFQSSQKNIFHNYRESPHRASSHSTDFSIVQFLKNIHSSHSTSINFSIVLFWAMFLYFILIVRISHSTVFWCSTLTVLWGDFLYSELALILEVFWSVKCKNFFSQKPFWRHLHFIMKLSLSVKPYKINLFPIIYTM